MLTVEIGETNPILRSVSTPINRLDFKQYVKLGKQMIDYIQHPKHGGCGIAAPQIGKNVRLIVVSLMKDWDDENYKTIMMLNPIITEHSSDENIESE